METVLSSGALFMGPAALVLWPSSTAANDTLLSRGIPIGGWPVGGTGVGNGADPTVNVGDLNTDLHLGASTFTPVPSLASGSPPLLPPETGPVQESLPIATGGSRQEGLTPPSPVAPLPGFETPHNPAAGVVLSTPQANGSLIPTALTSENGDGKSASPELPNRGLTRVRENSGQAKNAAGQAWRDLQSQTEGAQVDPVTGDTMAPALRYDNANSKGQPFVKFDGVRTLPDGTKEMIEAKNKIVIFRTKDGPFIPDATVKQIQRQVAALKQNPGFKGVLEVPNEQVAKEASNLLRRLKTESIVVRLIKGES